MNKLEFVNRALDNLNDSIGNNGKIDLMNYISLTNDLYESIKINPKCDDVCKFYCSRGFTQDLDCLK